MDNGTMVEVLKFLNYSQLAKNSIVSKRFRDLIQTHRHTLALLYVDKISMMRRWSSGPTIKIFSNDFSAEEYNEWLIRNNYSKQIPVEEERITAYFDETYHYLKVYELTADYKDPSQDTTSALFAKKNVNNETWPLFQHFVRLLTDPFIHIRRMELVPQNDVFSLLASTIDRSNCGRLRCENLTFAVQSNYPKFLNWIKDHVRCFSFRIDFSCSPNCFTQLLDFSATGSDCTSEMSVYMYISKAFITDLVQKFMNVNNCDESHFVHTIRGFVTKRTIEALNSEYGEFFIKEDSKGNGRYRRTAHVFEFVNVDIGKKIQLTVVDYIELIALSDYIILKIVNL